MGRRRLANPHRAQCVSQRGALGGDLGGIAQRSERPVVNRCQRGFNPHFRLRTQCPSSLSDEDTRLRTGRAWFNSTDGRCLSCLSRVRPPGCPSPIARRAVWSPGSISIDTCLTHRTDRGRHPGAPPRFTSGRSSVRRAPVWEAGGRRGRSCRPDHRFHQRVAQPEERRHRKPEAAGAGPATLTSGVVVQRPRTPGRGPGNMGSTPIHPSLASGIPNGKEPP